MLIEEVRTRIDLPDLSGTAKRARGGRFRTRAKELCPLKGHTERPFDTNTSLGFSRNGKHLPITAEATGRLVYEAIQALGEPLSARAANALFVALAMDTGWFRHNNATARSFGLAADLVRAGANPEMLYEHLFENNTLPRLKLMGLVLDRLQITNDGRVAHSEILNADYGATGAVPPDTEDLVNFTRSIQGVEVGILFLEQPRGGVKVSFRARDKVDVACVAEKFGGGGHRRASGATLNLPLDEARKKVFAALAVALDSLS